MIKIGSARSSKLSNDGQVSEQPFYTHQKGWIVVHAKKSGARHLLCLLMREACDNNNLRYSQPKREEIYKNGVSAEKITHCDCSSLLTQIIREALTNNMKNSTTATLPLNCMLTGLFEAYDYKDGITKLYNGDILVTKTKGHCAIVTHGGIKNK